MKPLEYFSKEFGPDKDEEELKKKWISSLHIFSRLRRGPSRNLSLLRCNMPAKSRVDAGLVENSDHEQSRLERHSQQETYADKLTMVHLQV